MKKELLKELCEHIQCVLNMNAHGKIETIELTSQLKPSDYYLPQMRIRGGETEMAWFVEIWYNGQCVVRESGLPREGEDPNIIEGFLIDKVIKSVFRYGVMSCKKYLDETSGRART